MLINVRRDVMAATENKQVPWEHSALRQRFFLNDDAIASAQLEETPAALQEGEGEFWTLVQASDDPAFYREYLAMFPSGRHVEKARVRLAALTGLTRDTSAASGADKPVTRSPAELATRAQTLLQRAGCYTGEIDGVWGRNSRYALRRALGPRIASSKLDPVIILRLEILVPGQCAPQSDEKQAAPTTAPTPPKAKSKPKVREARRPPPTEPSSRERRRKAARDRIRRENERRARREARQRASASNSAPKISRRKSNEISAECRSWRRCAGASHPYRVRIDCPDRPRGCRAWND